MPFGRSCVFIFATNQFLDSVFKAQTDENYMNTFINKHKKFILISAFRATKRFISENDDEYSVAMIAFCEAVKSYEESKGSFKGICFFSNQKAFDRLFHFSGPFSKRAFC